MLHHAVIRKKVSLVEKLLQRKDLHDVVDEQGNTAFHLACLREAFIKKTSLISIDMMDDRHNG